MKRIAVLLPVFNNLSYTKKCLANLKEILSRSGLEEQFPIIIIDDGSTDGTGEWIRKNFSEAVLLQGNGNLWWSGGINMGARHAFEQMKCDYLLLWNNDIQIKENYFETACKVLSAYDDRVIVGSKIYADREGKVIWSMGGIFNPRTGYCGMKAFMAEENNQYNKPVEVDWITGMGTFIPAKVVESIGYWDDKFFPQYHGDTEYTYRAKLNGFRNIIHPGLIIWNDITNTGLSHKGNFSTLIRLLSDKRSLYNWKVNTKFHQKYAKGIFAWQFLISRYFRLFGGFFKWKFLNLFMKHSKTSLRKFPLIILLNWPLQFLPSLFFFHL